MKIIVLESDIQQYHRIRSIIESYDAQYEVIGPFTTTEQASDHIMAHVGEVDIIVADTVLADGDVFDALDCAPQRVPVIFCTAHDEYALKAFSYLSLSYLIKPVTDDAMTSALAKAVRLRRDASQLTPKGSWASGGQTARRIVAKTLHGERIIHTSTIRYVVSEQRNTYIKLLDGSSYRIDKTLEQTEQIMPEDFMRVNRKFIIPKEQVDGTENIENGKMLLLLKGSKAPTVIVSRTRKVDVCKWLQA